MQKHKISVCLITATLALFYFCNRSGSSDSEVNNSAQDSTSAQTVSTEGQVQERSMDQNLQQRKPAESDSFSGSDPLQKIKEKVTELTNQYRPTKVAGTVLKERFVEILDKIITTNQNAPPSQMLSLYEYVGEVPDSFSNIPIFLNKRDNTEQSSVGFDWFRYYNPFLLGILKEVLKDPDVISKIVTIDQNDYFCINAGCDLSTLIHKLVAEYRRLQQKSSLDTAMNQYRTFFCSPKEPFNYYNALTSEDRFSTAFWVRRYLDGTHDKFFELILDLDKELSRPENYFVNGELSSYHSKDSLQVCRFNLGDLGIIASRINGEYSNEGGEENNSTYGFLNVSLDNDSLHIDNDTIVLYFYDHYDRPWGNILQIVPLRKNLKIIDVAQKANTHFNVSFEGPHGVIDSIEPVSSPWKILTAESSQYTIVEEKDAELEDFPKQPLQSEYEGGSFYAAIEEVLLRIRYRADGQEKKLILKILTPSGD